MARVAVVDLGSNSTRLLVADVQGDGRVDELLRRSLVTRLGQGVERTGALDAEAVDRVRAVLEAYRAEIDRLGCDVAVGVLTSAVRDAANGADFAAEVRDRYGISAHVLGGDEEAQLTFLGATSAHPPGPEPLLVVDIGGGSTELIVGEHGEAGFHVSTQVGVVRHTERHLHDDPPTPEQLRALRTEVAGQFADAVPGEVRTQPAQAIAVAGTATQCASVELGLEPYDPAKVHGHLLTREAIEAILDRLGAMPLAQRRDVTGLDPERAPTIVAGAAILLEALDVFGLDRAEVSEHDILRGVALDHSAFLS